MRKQLIRTFTTFLVLFSILIWGTSITKSESLKSGSSSDFYIIYTDNFDDGLGADLFITSVNNTYGSVEIPGIGFSQQFTVLADTITTIDIPLTAEVQGSDVIADLGIRVTAKDDITVYFLNPGEPVYTNDAYVAMPVETLGTEYIVMAWPDNLPARGVYNEGFSELAIVAPFDNTTVSITPSVNTGSRLAGVAYNISLDQFQTYTLQSDQAFEDLTGTLIQSSSPVAVFSGNRCADIPVGYGYCDHLIEQMAPINAWGKSFVTVPLASRTNGDYFRILASVDGTIINIDGSVLPSSVSSQTNVTSEMNVSTQGKGVTHNLGDGTSAQLYDFQEEAPKTIATTSTTLNRGGFYEFRSTNSLVISASQPIMVAQFSTGSDFDGITGDPFMMVIPPSEQFLPKYTFLTPTGYSANFVTIVAPTSTINSLFIDGNTIDSASFSTIGSSGFSGASIPLSEGSHTIKGNSPFGVYVYGFGSYVSYGYPGGLGSNITNPPLPPTDRLPVVFLPGFGGTRLVNDEGELWINIERMCNDAANSWFFRPTSQFLDVLRLDNSGLAPFDPNDPHFTSVQAGSVLTRVVGTCDLGWKGGTHPIDMDIYQSLIDHFQSQGYVLGQDLFLFGYDWRRNINESSDQLDNFIDSHRQGGKVNLVGHSMGGMVARNYILNPTHAAKVENMVILGTPLLGTPDSFKGLNWGDDFGINENAQDNGLPGFSWILNEDRIREIVQNWPGLYEFLPSQRFFELYENGYIQEERDVDGDGTAVGSLDYDATNLFLSRLFNNQTLSLAEHFHSDEFDGFDKGTNGVNIYLIVGLGHGTRERIRFWEEEKWYGLKTEQHASWFYGNGDNLTPQRSLDLQDGDSDFRGGVGVYYSGANHGELPRNTHVQQQIIQLLSGNINPVNENISTSPDKWPLNGFWTEVNSPVELHIYDELGNHLGPSVNNMIEYGIKEAQYDLVGHDKSVFIPKGIDYTVVLTGTDEGEFDLRLRDVESGVISTTVLFKDVSVSISSTAKVSLDPEDNFIMAFDREGDGIIDNHISPTVILDSQNSLDFVSPTTVITLTGSSDEQGWFTGNVTIAIAATDNLNGSGVERIEYSLDEGNSVQIYNGPFLVNSKDVAIIYAKAIDKAGNEEFPLTSERLNPIETYLPIIVK